MNVKMENSKNMEHESESTFSLGQIPPRVVEAGWDLDLDAETAIKCHFCKRLLHADNNAMTRCMNGQNPAPHGFGWVSVMVKSGEVPCCDVCMGNPETQYLMA